MIGMVVDMITSKEMSRGGLANDLLEVELLNERGGRTPKRRDRWVLAQIEAG
jgi:hypothetical protein